MFVVARLSVMLLTVAAAGAALVGPWHGGAAAAERSTNADPDRRMAWAMSTALAGGIAALGVLALAFLTEDWRFATVVGHARPGVPWTLRVAAIWAGPEGSLLLWTTMLAGVTLAAIRLASRRPGRLLAATTAGYGLILMTAADPFDRLAAPPGEGNGLQPVLEHPAMLWHPPVLYLGLIAILVPSTLFVTSRSNRRSRQTLAWTLPAALALLTAGLATGANWAYVELGWGGYWAWDPIENAGLVAWLAGASLLHRAGRDSSPGREAWWPRSMALVGVVPGIAAIWATTITRTGVLSSVHSFADRPTLRLMLLTIAVLFTVTLAGLAVRDPWSTRPEAGAVSSPRSVAGFAAVGSAMIVVAVGTYEPALETLVRDQSFTTSARFYTLLLWPIAVAGSVLRVRAVVRATATNVPVSGSPGVARRILTAAVVGAIGAMVVVTAAVGATGLVLAAAGGAVAGSALFDEGASRGRGRSRLAHIGIGVLMVGVAGTTAATTDTIVALADAEAVTPVGVVIHHGVDIFEVDGTTEAVASVELTENGRSRTLHPKLVSYPATGGQSTEVDTDRGWLTDVQVVLVDADAERATYRISRHPRISLVWLGAALTTIGLAATAAARRREARLQPEAEAAVP